MGWNIYRLDTGYGEWYLSFNEISNLAQESRAADWRKLIQAVRKVYSGEVSIDFLNKVGQIGYISNLAPLSSITWADSLDFVFCTLEGAGDFLTEKGIVFWSIHVIL